MHAIKKALLLLHQITYTMKALCLFEHSKTFANLFEQNGYEVISVDLKLGIDINQFDYQSITKVDVIIAHPPCTEFAVSGARWWASKPVYLLENAIQLVDKTLEIINYHNPRVWFVENPIGRIEKCVPVLRKYKKWSFNPYEFAGYSDNSEAYSKKTVLWGKFNIPIKKPLPNLLGSKMHNLGWRNEKVLEERSITPKGFAKAFVEANLKSKSIQEQLKLFNT